MKVIRVTMPDGSRWDVPAAVVAHNRAAHYATDGGPSGTEGYQRAYDKEYRHSLLDDADLLDWATGGPKPAALQ